MIQRERRTPYGPVRAPLSVCLALLAEVGPEVPLLEPIVKQQIRRSQCKNGLRRNSGFQARYCNSDLRDVA